MDHRKEYLRYKFRDIKRKNPGFFVSHGMAGFFRFLSLPLIIVSISGLIVFFFKACIEYLKLAASESHTMAGDLLKVADLTDTSQEIFILYILLSFACLLILLLCISIRILGRQVTNRNDYILELEQLGEEMAEGEGPGQTNT